MADQIVSWGGIDSKGTSGMGVTGSLVVSGSIRAKNTITFFGNSAQNAPGSITNDSSDNLIVAAAQGSGKGTYLGVTNGSAVAVGSSNINFYTGNGIATHQMIVGYNSNNSIGNVGIGTSTPSATLTVKGTGTTSSTTALLVQNANASASFSVRDDQSIIINGSSSMTIPNSGSALTITRTGNYSNVGTKPILNILDDTGGANVAKGGIYVSITGASNNRAIEAYGGVGFGITPSDNQFQVAYPTQITNTVTAVSSNNNYVLTLKSLTSFATNAGTGISFWGDDRGQGTAVSAFAGIRGVKENSSYLNSLGNLVFYVQTGSAGGLTETTYREAARFNSSGSFGIGITTPSASLHISGSSGSALFEIDSPAVNNILYVSGSGNVGIGTGTPTATLHVSGSGRFTNGLTVSGSINMTGSYSLRGGNGSFVSSFNYTSSAYDSPTFYNFNDQYNFANSGNNSTVKFYNFTPSIVNTVGGFADSGRTDNNIVGVAATYTATGNDSFQYQNQIRIAPSVTNYRYFNARAIYFAPTLTSISVLDFRFLENTTGDSYFNTTSGVVNIGSTTGLGARLGVKGTGTTSSTTSFLVQNANASASLQVRDDGTTTIASNTNRGYNLDVNGTGIINDCYFGDSLGPRIRASGGSGIISCVYNSLTLSSGANVGVSNNTFTVGPGSDTNGQLTVTTPAKVANTSETVNISAGNMYYGGGEGRFVIQAQGNASGYNALGNMYIAGGRNTNGGAHGNVYLGVDLTSPLGNVSVGTTSSLNYKFNVSGSGNFTNNLTVTGSLTVSSILTLTPQDPLPSGVPTGSFAVSSSAPPKPYFYDGTTWNALY